MVDEAVIGIDLGTTYSAAAYVDGTGKSRMLPNAEGQYLTPSALYFTDHSIIVGQPALNAGLNQPNRLAQFVKRHIGDESWQFRIDGRAFSATELSAEILRKLKLDSEHSLGVPIQKAVVTVPAYFGEPERRATVAAAEAAGLELLRLINEPTAAAISYGIDSNESAKTVLFYDLGGGTFDLTACRIDQQGIHVLASEGHVQLGGKDFDDQILQYVSDRFRASFNLDPRDDTEMVADLRERAVNAKHLLTSMEQAQVLVVAHGKRLSVEITRNEFENISKRLMRRTQNIVMQVLQESGLGLNDIDRVVLVGGSSRMPMVKRTLTGYINCPVMLASNPDEVVALGAAIVAHRAVMTERDKSDHTASSVVGGIVVEDVVSHSIGIQAKSASTGRLQNRILIPRNTRIPYEAKFTFSVDRDNATSLRFVVCQGESEKLEDCRLIGEFILSDLPPGRPRGTPVEVNVKCNENAIIEIRAVDPQTGKSANITVNYYRTNGQAPNK